MFRPGIPRALLLSTTVWAATVAAPGLFANPQEYVLMPVENPVFHGSQIFVSHEDLRSDRFRELVERYGLSGAVADEPDEFKRILRLRHWIKSRIRIENVRPTETRGDAFGILDAALQGGGFHCGHFMVVQNAVLNAFGHVARCLGVGPGGTAEAPGLHHGVNEVWVNALRKWVLVDAKYDIHFERDGRPLSALEIRDELLKNGAADVRIVQGPERIRVAEPEEPEGGPQTYRWLTWEIQGNRHSNWPGHHSSALVLWEDDYARNYVWWRIGRSNRHWAYEADYFVPTSHRDWIEWTPNVLQVEISLRGRELDGKITSSTPNLKEYQIREASGGEWRPIEALFTLPLTQSKHEWRLRSVNLAGVSGPEHRVAVERKQ